MTLVVGVRCQEGLVIGADSQETVGSYRVAAQKIESHQMGNYQVSFAGSGYGDLIESFVQCLRERLDGDPSTTVTAFKSILESEYALFRQNDVPLYPAPTRQKSIRAIVGVASTKGVQSELWTLKATRLRPIQHWDLVGFEDPLYKNIIQRLYSAQTSIAQGILLAIYLFTIAEGISNYIKGPMSVAIVSGNGIRMEDPSYVQAMANRLKEYERHINSIFLACADTSIAPDKFSAQLSDFSAYVSSLHSEHISDTLRNIISGTTEHPYPKVPIGEFYLTEREGDVIISTPPEGPEKEDA